jgi:uncharacterized membrane protein
MDKMFAFLFFVSIAGNVANFYHSNPWVHSLNALPVVLFLTMTAISLIDDGKEDNKKLYRQRFATYLGVLYIIQFGLEYLRQLIVGVSISENCEHLVIIVTFITFLVFIRIRKQKNVSQNPQTSVLSNEAQKNGNS